MAYCKILLPDGVTELANIKSVTYREAVNSGVDLRPGCVGSASIEVEVFGAQSSAVSAGDALKYYQIDKNNTQTLIGTFYAEPVIATKNSYRFVAYDAAYKLNADFSAWLRANQSSFPMTIKALVTAACTAAGVTLGSSSWSLSSQNVQAFYADGLTCRNILEYAAELGCKFVRCHTDGKVYFDWYATKANTRIYPSAGVSGSETRYAYKQDGLNYTNYTTTAIARVAVHPSGENDVAYIYPTGVNSGNTLNITNNLLLTGAASSLYNSAAQTIYTALNSLGTYRPATAHLFPRENPFRAGDIVAVTDSQGVSFTTVVMEATVSESDAVLSSTGNQTYDEGSGNTAKSLTQLASDVVRINKLKVGWAEIDQVFAEEITVTGSLHSSDYNYTNGQTYANAGMGIDFGAKRMNTKNFSLTPDGKIHATGGEFTNGSITGSSFVQEDPQTHTSVHIQNGEVLMLGAGNVGSIDFNFGQDNTSPAMFVEGLGENDTLVSTTISPEFASFGGDISVDGGIASNNATISGAVSANSLALTTPLPVASGGTGGTDAATARVNLGVDALISNTLSNTNYSDRPSAAEGIWNSMSNGTIKVGRVTIGGTNYMFEAMRNSANYAVCTMTSYSGANIYRIVKTNGTVSSYTYTGTAS